MALCFGIGKPLAFRHRNPITVRKQAQCFGKREALDLLDECEDIALRITAKTFVELKTAVDIERGSLFRMKRTKTLPALTRSLALQGHVLLDYLNKVELPFELLGKIHVCASLGQSIFLGELSYRVAASKSRFDFTKLA